MTAAARGPRMTATQMLSVKPLRGGSALGVEVAGVDLAQPLSHEMARELGRLLLAHQVLVFRDQHLESEEQVRFAGRFGVVREARQSAHFPCSHPQAHYLSTVDAQGRPTLVHPDPHTAYWHSDGSWMRTPPRATVLHCVQISGRTGDTSFASMYELASSLEPDARRELEDARAIHHVELSRANRDGRWPWQWRGSNRPTFDDFKWWAHLLLGGWARGAATHPVIRCHPETGRKALFIGDHAWRLIGMSPLAGIRRMRELNDLALGATCTYTHRWRTGDVVIWDNGSVLHKGEALDLSQTRVLRRCVVLRDPSHGNPSAGQADA